MRTLNSILLLVLLCSIAANQTALAWQADASSGLVKRIDELSEAISSAAHKDRPVLEQRRLELELRLAMLERDLTSYPNGSRWVSYLKLTSMRTEDTKSATDQARAILQQFKSIVDNERFQRVVELPDFRAARQALELLISTPPADSAETGSAESAPSEAAPTEPAASEAAPTEPAPTEPAPTEPAPTEPAPTEPALTEPSATEPAATEPAASEPVATEPAATEPAVTEPAVTEPSATEPAATEPAATEPAATEPAVTEPAATEPAATEPAATEPAATEPAATEPAATEPAATEPAANEPAATEPAANEPAATDAVPIDTASAEPVATDTELQQKEEQAELQPDNAVSQTPEEVSSEGQMPAASTSAAPSSPVLMGAALFVIVFLIVGLAAAVVFLGSLPGHIAQRRHHPYLSAVKAASWIGLATGVFWPIAFIWAFCPWPKPRKTPATAESAADSTTAVSIGSIRERMDVLAAAVAELQTQKSARS